MPQDASKLHTQLNKKKVNELKELLTERGLSTKGLKAELVSRLVEDMVKEGTKDDTKESSGSQDNAENNEQDNGDKKEDEPKVEKSAEKRKARTPSPERERSASPARRSPSPTRKESTPSPVRAKDNAPSPVRGAKSPSPVKNKSPSPTRESMVVDEPKKRKEQELTSSTNSGAKRQRKWESKGGNDISISSDTLDMLTENLPIPQPTQTPRSQEPRVVIRKSQEITEPTGERRVPPARKPESRTLFIDRFVRPFLPKQVKELLEKTGEVDYFWMNNVRSHCYVTFKTVEQAKATREAVYNLVWPPANKSALIAEFSTEEEALRRAAIAKAREEPAQPQQQQQAAAPQPALSKSTEQARTDRDKERGDRDNRDNRDNRDRRDGDRRDNRDRRDSDRHDRDRRDTKPPPPPKVTLESLFRKTVARPCVYWLPLTDKDVEDKQNKANTATTAST